MTAAAEKTLHERLALLREPFPATEIGKLPRVNCKACRDNKQAKVCDRHTKRDCAVCGNWITTAHIHLDYLGHAETTDRFLFVDPAWSWEPVAWTADGMPAINRHGPNLVMWGRLTLCGVTRPGVGTAPADKEDAHKELIGDFLRNAGMRFGVGLDLWRKSEKAEAAADVERPDPSDGDEPTAQPEPPYWERLGWESDEDHQGFRALVKREASGFAVEWSAWWRAAKLGWPLARSDKDRVAAKLAEMGVAARLQAELDGDEAELAAGEGLDRDGLPFDVPARLVDVDTGGRV